MVEGAEERHSATPLLTSTPNGKCEKMAISACLMSRIMNI